MNKKIQLPLLLLCLLLSDIASAQTSQLFLENFNEGNSSFTLNVDTLASGTGSNQWIVNSQYNGKGIYPNTTNETNTVSDTIALPDSNYLHIYDTLLASIVSNCNYNNTVASDNFAYMTSGFCTQGFSNVHFTFFYIAGGNATDYGSVYYKADGGPWTQCGAAQYNNQTIWKQEDITLPAFENHYSLQFGFRWTNIASGGLSSMSFGIDDITATGDYNPSTPLQVSVTSISPDTVCAETFFKLGYKLSQPFCDGTYQIVMSDSVGNFSGDTSNLGTFSIAQGDTTGFITAIAPIASGSCFKFRIDRVSPAPSIKGIPGTTCFTINNCANTVTTLQPSVTYGPDTLCDGSVMDVPFYSTGTFTGNNTYIAQLSDANGSFANPLIIGTSADSTTYDPFQIFFPGYVSGTVPVTAPGCNYYIRVLSTGPAITPAPNGIFGPFCIRDCDITINSMQDIDVCVSDTVGTTDTISIKTNSWNKNVHYAQGNKFIAQLLETFNYSVINDIPLGVVTADTTTKLVLRIPSYDSLFAKEFLFPGIYYLRIIATNTSSQSDTMSNIVRFTVGFSDPAKPLLAAYDDNFNVDSIFCGDSDINLYMDNYNLFASYQWETSLPLTGLSNPFLADPPLTITLNPLAQTGRFWFITREDYFGCFSPWSDTTFITILGKPDVFITESSTCLDDTVNFSVPFQLSTNYNWTINQAPSFHQVIKNSNNLLEVVFDSSLTYTVTVTAKNECATATANATPVVSPKPIKPILNPTINGVTDTIVYSGNLLKVYITNYNPTQSYLWETSLNISVPQPFNNISPLPLLIGSPNAPGLYWVIVKEDLDGCYSNWSDTIWIDYTGTNGIANVNAMEQIHLIPNPATDKVLIQIPPAAEVNKLELMDMLGTIIKTQAVNNSNTILDIEQYAAGVYFIRLTGAGSKVFKLVKE